jgi:hypothetical protein
MFRDSLAAAREVDPRAACHWLRVLDIADERLRRQQRPLLPNGVTYCVFSDGFEFPWVGPLSVGAKIAPMCD